VLLLHLLRRTNSSAKISELGKFLLDFLQPLLPLAVCDLGLWSISASEPISVVQLLKLCDLGAETPNLVVKHCEMIHAIKDNASRTIERRSGKQCHDSPQSARTKVFGLCAGI